MSISVFDLFSIGIGPSSSHTVGPMRAARRFAVLLNKQQDFDRVARVKAEMYGSLGATGSGHGTPDAVLMGLEGEQAETIDTTTISSRVERIRVNSYLHLLKKRKVTFSESDLVMHQGKSLPEHPNGMRFTAYDRQGESLLCRTFFSVGGGFVVEDTMIGDPVVTVHTEEQAFPFTTCAELLRHCQQKNCQIADLMLENEKAWRSEQAIDSALLNLWQVMQESVKAGFKRAGKLPGGLNIQRRAPQLYQQLLNKPEAALSDPLLVIDWVTLYALAVNEENASGGRIVTAPTNGAAGIIPAVLHYYWRFIPNANEKGIKRFLLTAAAIGMLYKQNASISGAEVGCQGEVGSACSMAAAGLTEVLGGTPTQVENAAEIAMEHNLGLTCDPVGGLVQVPCIERNAMSAVKAIHASRLALRGDGSHFVSLDKVIKTMRDTGRDMQDKYKETSRGGLAVNVVEVPVNIIEC